MAPEVYLGPQDPQAKEVLEVSEVLQVHKVQLVSLEHPEEEACLDLMDQLVQKVRVEIEE